MESIYYKKYTNIKKKLHINNILLKNISFYDKIISNIVRLIKLLEEKKIAEAINLIHKDIKDNIHDLIEAISDEDGNYILKSTELGEKLVHFYKTSLLEIQLLTLSNEDSIVIINETLSTFKIIRDDFKKKIAKSIRAN